MKAMMDKLNEYKWIVTTTILVLTFGWWLKGIESDAGEAKQKVDSIEQTYKSIEKIAEQVQANQKALCDPKRMLGDFLITMGDEPNTVKYWMSMPVGLEEIKITDSTYMVDIPFILDGDLPWLGIRAVIKQADSTAAIRIFDTLWDHRSEQ